MTGDFLFNLFYTRTVMIQLAESILPEDTSLGVAYLLALDEVCLTDI